MWFFQEIGNLFVYHQNWYSTRWGSLLFFLFFDDFFTKNLNFEFFGRYYIVFLRDMYFGSFWSILYCLFEVLFDFSVDNSHIVLQCFREYHSVFLMIVLSNIWKYAPPPFPVNMPPPHPYSFFIFKLRLWNWALFWNFWSIK